MAMTEQSAAPNARRGRAKYAAMSVIVVFACTLSAVLATALGDRFAARVDVTSTREHELSPRTITLLDALTDEYEFVIAGDRRAIDRRSWDTVRDVIERISRQQPGVSASFIDTGSATGMAEYERLIGRLARREEAALAAQAAAAQRGAAGLEELAAYVESLSPRLLAIRAAIAAESPASETNRAYFEQRAAVARLTSQRLREAAGESRAQAVARRVGDAEFVLADQAISALIEPMRQLTGDLEALGQNLRAFADGEAMTPAARDAAGPMAAEVLRQRDRAAVMLDELRGIRPTDLARVARVLESNSAALVIGPVRTGPSSPGGVTAVAFDELLPSTQIVDTVTGAAADLSRNAEELLSTALAGLASPLKPIVVLMHGEPAKFFDDRAVFDRVWSAVASRLALRGIDLVEWAAAIESTPPPLSKLDPTGNRPVVYVSVGTNSAAPGVAGGKSGAERAGALGKRLTGLMEAGEPVLVSIVPSTLPTFGEPDATVAGLPLFGLRADSARPVLTERVTPRGRSVETERRVTVDAAGGHPIAIAARGLPMLLTWPIAIDRVEAASGVRVMPLIMMDEASGGAWRESQWASYFETPRESRALVASPPSNDSPRDAADGPWMVAAAAEREISDGSRGRLVVVGSNGWFTDPITQRQQVVDGRVTTSSPGSLEFFEAAVFWLAGQDQFIAQSATARAIPMIRPLEPTTVKIIQWSMIAGLPLLILLFGGLWRMLRG